MRIFSKAACAPLSVRKSPTGLPKRIVAWGSKGMTCSIFLVVAAPQGSVRTLWWCSDCESAPVRSMRPKVPPPVTALPKLPVEKACWRADRRSQAMTDPSECPTMLHFGGEAARAGLHFMNPRCRSQIWSVTATSTSWQYAGVRYISTSKITSFATPRSAGMEGGVTRDKVSIMAEESEWMVSCHSTGRNSIFPGAGSGRRPCFLRCPFFSLQCATCRRCTAILTSSTVCRTPITGLSSRDHMDSPMPWITKTRCAVGPNTRSSSSSPATSSYAP
mmetsp:Transcript_41483/g.81309  ORF Transcript_41483/g.81309 Transcript_41483/m.81309 type:complete len:275 (+) Transcript_41483:1340-2164(+)